MNLVDMEIACFYVKMNYDFEMITLYSSMNVELRTLDWRLMEECLIRDIVGYSNLFRVIVVRVSHTLLLSTVMWERLVVAIMCVPDVLVF